jgi:plastocyanin
MNKNRESKWLHYLLVGSALVVALPLFAAACGTDIKPLENRVGAIEQSITTLRTEMASLKGQATLPAGKQTFYVTAVEWKGTTSADKLPPPSIDPVTLSKGYGFKGPGAFDTSKPQDWQVSTYVYTPGAMMVNQGDEVEVVAFVVNGDHHNTRVIAPDGAMVGQPMDAQRGREYKFSFTASQAGVYRLVCDTHAPTMTANILALPKG